MCSWGKLWTRYKKDPKPHCYFWKAGSKAGYCACPLHTNTTRGVTNHLSHPSSLTPGHIPTLTPWEAALPSGYKQAKGTWFLLSLPCCSRAPVNLCLNFTGHLSISIDYGGHEAWLVTLGVISPASMKEHLYGNAERNWKSKEKGTSPIFIISPLTPFISRT